LHAPSPTTVISNASVTLFRESDRVSIDTLLNALPANDWNDALRKIGRSAIACVLLLCERYSKLTGNWYQWFLEFLLRDGPDFPAGKISIVTFNYDRSLEFYLRRAFKRSFELKDAEACEMVERLDFIHVYGDLGELPADYHQAEKLFGNRGTIFTAAEGLRIAGIRLDDVTQPRVTKAIDEADRLIFLGFGFWKENMDVLHNLPKQTILDISDVKKEPPESWHRKKIFASRYKLAESDRIETDARVGALMHYVGAARPLITWGESDHDLWRFVTHVNLKEKVAWR